MHRTLGPSVSILNARKVLTLWPPDLAAHQSCSLRLTRSFWSGGELALLFAPPFTARLPKSCHQNPTRCLVGGDLVIPLLRCASPRSTPGRVRSHARAVSHRKHDRRFRNKRADGARVHARLRKGAPGSLGRVRLVVTSPSITQVALKDFLPKTPQRNQSKSRAQRPFGGFQMNAS